VMPGSMPGQPMSLADAFTQAAQRAMQAQQTQTGIG
jgi:non-canonical (house-cleaning) NTP pyrophosphatase